MGFTPSTTKEGLERNNGDVTQTIDWLVSNKLTADELASPNHLSVKSTALTIDSQPAKADADDSQKELNTRGQDCTSGNTSGEFISEVSNGASTTQDTMNNAPALPNPEPRSPASETRSPLKVQVIIPTKPMKAAADSPSFAVPSRKAKRRKTTLDQPEAVLEYSDVVTPVPERKRGRGRPKKTVHTAASTDVVQEDEQKTSLGSTLENLESNQVDFSVPSEILEAAVSPQEAVITAAVSTTTPEPPPLPTRPEASPITPERTVKSVKRDQSASGKGKIPYRVGLSKRARVAPLLRTMRK